MVEVFRVIAINCLIYQKHFTLYESKLASPHEMRGNTFILVQPRSDYFGSRYFDSHDNHRIIIPTCSSLQNKLFYFP